MYSSRRKSKRSYRKRVTSRKNKTRSKRKNLKFRKMRGGKVTSYYTFIEEYERAQDYITREVAKEINTKNIQKLEREYPDFLETYKIDKANDTKSADRLTPEEEARIAAQLAENETRQLQADAYVEERKKILAEPGFDPHKREYRDRLDELSRNLYSK